MTSPDLIFETVCVGPMQVNCYVLASGYGKKAIVIDPGDQFRKIKEALDRHKLTASLVVNTHGHYDHIGCDDKFDVPVYVHSMDSSLLTDPMLNLSGLFAVPYSVKAKVHLLNEFDIIELDGIKLKVIHIPGHTSGGIALHLLKPTEKIVFTGDSLFCQSIGRSDLDGGNQDLLIKSIKEKLFILDDDTVVYPGHGMPSTIGEEKRHNPFLQGT